ncbi:tetrathionate reductase subunit A [Neisseriaceae bacterium CLB008]
MANLDKKKRLLLKGGLAAGGAVTFAAGYSKTAKDMVVGLVKGTSAEPTLDRITGNALTPEGRIGAAGWDKTRDQVVSHTQCFGCWTLCGLRVRVDKPNNKVLRVMGNPYHPLSHDHHFGYQTPIADAFQRLGGETGLEERSTACARGAAILESLDSPYRITEPLKRVGKRGEGKWQRISFEQLVDEVVNGGDLFGEGHVEGLKAIRDLDTLIDPANPEFGPKANQLLVSSAGEEGREVFLKRFVQSAYGSKNFANHGSYCGLAYRSGSGALMNDQDSNKHAKPDWDHLEFGLFMGTSPAQSGNPFKRQGRQLTNARRRDDFSYVVIAPNLPLSNTLATPNNTWIPIQPGTDVSLAMAMIRWIFDHNRFNAEYLSLPSQAAMAEHNDKSWSNATHLVISAADHPKNGHMLRLQDVTGAEPGMDEEGKPLDSPAMVKDAVSGAIRSAEGSGLGTLWVDEAVILADGSSVAVKSSLTLLRESANRFSLAEYSQQCGVSVATIEALAKKFTSHGRKAAVISHGGMMSGNGFYSTWAILMLNVLIGNMNYKGGMGVSGGKFKECVDGARYHLASFDGMVKPKGILLSRAKKAYETTSEFKAKQAAGTNPYPAKMPWYPFAGGQLSEMLVSATEGYPYPLKAWVSHMTNPVYGMAGLKNGVVEKLKDPKVLPLFVAVDAFINETTALADYIVPDTHNFESWGWAAPWAGVPAKSSTARWPIVTPKTGVTASGDTVAMESFIIALAKKMSLPGYGDNVIADVEGQLHPLNNAADFFLRAGANVAFDGEQPVPETNAEELYLTGVDRLLPEIQRCLKPEEQLRVGYVLTRGGRFAPNEKGWNGDGMGPQWYRTLQVWNENVGKQRHAISGEQYSGCPTYYPTRFADGSDMRSHYPQQEWPLKLTSFKSHLMSSGSGSVMRLRMIKPSNIVGISAVDAAKWGVDNGDTVNIVTPSGKKAAEVNVLDGVMPGVLAIEHGYGHTEMGARTHYVDGQALPSNAYIGSGLNLNDLGIVDPTRNEPSPWLDWITGAVVRQGIPARLEKV